MPRNAESQGQTAGGDGASDAAAARAARLAALERRGLGAAPAKAESAAAAPAKAAPKAVDPTNTKARKDAEKAEILRQIAAEREEFAMRRAPVPQATGTANTDASAPQASQENAELRSAALEAAQ